MDGRGKACLFMTPKAVLNARPRETALREGEQRFRTIFEEGPVGIALVGPDQSFIQANRALCRMLGYTEPELAGSPLSSIAHPDDKRAVEELARGLFSSSLTQCRSEKRFLRKNRRTIWVRMTASVVRGPGGEPLYALSMIENITKRKRSEQRIVSALREKEILLREIHHRVKNNLQVISSLLNLQAGCIRDAKALEMLKESQNRVRSMAMVHDLLHRSNDLSKIHFGAYVRSLAASLFSSYGIDSSRVKLRVNVSDMFLNIDTAIPCGLIVHELVANALKHAFPENREGEVSIGVQPARNGRLALTVRDNGIGCPGARGVKSLGLRLVNILAEQIEGVVKRSARRGFQVRITFRETQSQVR